MNLKTVLKGLIVVEKRRLGFDPIFCCFRDNCLSFVDPIPMMPTATRKKGGIASGGMEGERTSQDR